MSIRFQLFPVGKAGQRPGENKKPELTAHGIHQVMNRVRLVEQGRCPLSARSQAKAEAPAVISHIRSACKTDALRLARSVCLKMLGR